MRGSKKIKFFWDIRLCHWGHFSRRFESL